MFTQTPTHAPSITLQKPLRMSLASIWPVSWQRLPESPRPLCMCFRYTQPRRTCMAWPCTPWTVPTDPRTGPQQAWTSTWQPHHSPRHAQSTQPSTTQRTPSCASLERTSTTSNPPCLPTWTVSASGAQTSGHRKEPQLQQHRQPVTKDQGL